MTLSSSCSFLLASLLILEICSIFKALSLLPVLLILLNSFLLWVNFITFLSPRYVLSLNLPQERRENASCNSMLQTGQTCNHTLISYECAERIIEVILFEIKAHIHYISSSLYFLKLTILVLALLIIVFLSVRRLSSGITVVFKLK